MVLWIENLVRGWGESFPTAKKFTNSSTWKNSPGDSPTKLLFCPTKGSFPPSTKLQFSCHNPIKNLIFIALFIALALSVRLILILINVDYCQNVFLRCLHGQNHSSSCSHHTMKEIFSPFPKNLTFNEDLPEKMNSQIWLYIFLLLWRHYLINFSKLV